MLLEINKKDIFHYDPGLFQVIETGTEDVVFLQHSGTGARLQTDRLGKTILKLLPGSFADVIKKLNSRGKDYVSARMLTYYLLLFWKTGVINKTGQPLPQPAGNTQDIPVNPPVDKRVSVVIVTFNGEKFIANNLDSLARQTLAPGEIIIVDNVSTDGSLEKVAQDYPAVKIIRNKKNYHYARAVNIGMEAAQGELTVILNQHL